VGHAPGDLRSRSCITIAVEVSTKPVPATKATAGEKPRPIPTSGLGLFTDAHAILHVAELGVVMFLFIIGLEMEPSIAVEVSTKPVPATKATAGEKPRPIPTSVRAAMQSTPKGQRIVAILLLEDLAIVPLLAVVALLAPGGAGTLLQELHHDRGRGQHEAGAGHEGDRR
jgi:Kef-type K+ transport system membrane component KefB